MFKSFEEWCSDKDNEVTEDKKSPAVHHDVDTWLTSVDNLKRELKALKDRFEEKAKKKGIEPEEKPEEEIEKEPEDKQEPEEKEKEEEENTNEKK